MRDLDLLGVLESRVREVERLAADCVLQGDARRVQRIVSQYCKAARIPKKKPRGFAWPALPPRSPSYGWPPV